MGDKSWTTSKKPIKTAQPPLDAPQYAPLYWDHPKAAEYEEERGWGVNAQEVTRTLKDVVRLPYFLPRSAEASVKGTIEFLEVSSPLRPRQTAGTKMIHLLCKNPVLGEKIGFFIPFFSIINIGGTTTPPLRYLASWRSLFFCLLM